MKVFIMQCPSAPCYFVLRRSKYSTQHPVLKILSLCYFTRVRDRAPHPDETTDEIITLCILTSVFVIGDNKTKDSALNVTGIPRI
jgi:hypothetical protein